MRTKHWAVLLVFIATILMALGQFAWKAAASSVSLNPTSLLNIYIIFGLTAYGISAIIFITALKGGDLTTLYPLMATSYVWVVLFSHILFPSDSLNLTKLLGLGVILLGVYFIARGTGVKK